MIAIRPPFLRRQWDQSACGQFAPGLHVLVGFELRILRLLLGFRQPLGEHQLPRLRLRQRQALGLGLRQGNDFDFQRDLLLWLAILDAHPLRSEPDADDQEEEQEEMNGDRREQADGGLPARRGCGEIRDPVQHRRGQALDSGPDHVAASGRMTALSMSPTTGKRLTCAHHSISVPRPLLASARPLRARRRASMGSG